MNFDITEIFDRSLFSRDVFGLPRMGRELELMHMTSKAEGTIRQYRVTLRAFLDYCRRRKLCIDLPRTVVAYRDHLLHTRSSAASVNAALAIVRLLYQYLYRNRLVKFDAMAYLQFQRVGRRHSRKCFSDQQVAALLTPVERDGDLRMRLFVSLGAFCGCRASEMLGINLDDIVQEKGVWIAWIRGKGHQHKDAPVLLHPLTLQLVKDYTDARRADGMPVVGSSPLLVTDSGRRLTYSGLLADWGRHLTARGINRREYSPHCLRHTCATKAIEGGASLLQVQAMLRHGSVATTQIYFHDRERIEKAAEKLVHYVGVMLA